MISSLRRLLPTLLFLSIAAHATLVTTAVDEDNGTLGGGTGISLREAVKYSPAADTITFAPALSGQAIRLTLGELTIAQSLTIDGSALPTRITLSGDKTGDGKTEDDRRVINITTGTVVLDSLVITGGYCSDKSPDTRGAGIHVTSTTTQLTLRDSAITGNSAMDGGAIYFYGLLNTPGSFLRIENSTLTANSATSEGGAIRIFGRLLIYGTTFTGNTARQGGAIYSRDGTFQVSNSHFAGNSATTEGGAIWTYKALTLTASSLSGNSAPYGGGIFSSFSGIITVENSTLTANSAREFGGGIFISGASTTLLHTTLTGNTALDGGGGMWRKISGSTPFGSLSLNRSIVTGNTAPDTPDVNTSGTFTGSNNLTSGAPRLAPLGNYGGPTHTMPPLPGSPAINTGGSTTLTTDQRGFPRIGTPDIGAAEYHGNTDLARFWKLDFDGDGSPYGTEQALGTDPSTADSASNRNLTAPVLNASGHAVLSFGIAPAVPDTRWILRRSIDLLTFTEIYRTDGTTDTAAPGVTFLRTASEITVTDTITPPGGAFYRFEAHLEP